ncbi:MAG: hydantoinase/oxoprolinase family protein, partial [Dehalococcoidia bacterium]
MTTLLGVDVGGTFTDFLIARDGGFEVRKTLSTPDDPSRAVLEGVEQMDEPPEMVLHGSTVATNAVLERRGARTALVATEGMRDLLVIGRQTRPDIYDLQPVTPEPLVPAELSFELHARLDPQGAVEQPADPSEVAALVEQARAGGAQALAVSLLYAYANPSLEALFEDAVREGGDEDGADENDGGLFLSLSSQVSPEYREVERTATTVLNAYVGPVMSRYLKRLASGLAERGAGPLRMLQSDGGAASAEQAARLPVATLLSGPAAGVSGALDVARRAGFDRIVTFDMGGTSTDVALCDGALPMRSEVVIDGFRARTPVVDVHTVGAGGGSIARIDAGGALRVGPQSAGADPGPACYGQGRDFTVTDAQALLGRLEGGLLGGAMALDARRSRRAASGLVHAFAGDPQAAAQAVIDVATANMERALRVVSVQRGYDPREFTLVAFGGAGPLHACALADALEMPNVLVPPMPGVLAALGAVRSGLTATRVHSVLLPLERSSAAALSDALDEAGDEARARLDAPQAELTRELDLRYAGQSYELTVAVDGDGDALDLDRAGAGFHELHEARYAHHETDASIEVVNVRVTARLPGRDIEAVPEFATGGLEGGGGEVWFAGERLEARFIDRASLTPGDRVEGVAIITQLDSTT